MTPTGRIALLVVVLLASTAAPVTAAESATLAGTQVDPDDVLMRIDLRTDGSAVWTIEYRVRLDDENATAAFESVRRDIENNSTAFAAPFRERMRATARSAENATGREMAISNVTASASRQQLPQAYGVVTYHFVWEGFADVEGDRIRSGDAIAGLFLNRQTTLVVAWPEGYNATELTPAPTDNRSTAATWVGPLDFTGSEPSVELQRKRAASGDGSAGGTTTVGGGDDRSEPTSGGDGGGGVPWLPLLATLLVVVVGLLGYLVVAQRDDPVGIGTLADDPSSRPSGGVDEEPDGTSTSRPRDGAAAIGERDSADSSPREPPEELLSNEERVLRLVRDRGGRIKQQEVASALEWTDAKTSQVVRKMRDDGDLDGFRLGRENVLTLPDLDPVPPEDDS